MSVKKAVYSKDYFRLKGENAENIVHELVTKSFLIDWCFVNPKLPNGKELCDLLVVFDDVIIIWQIKNLKLYENGKYKESEVEKNLRQLSGAKRLLFNLKTPIILKNARRKNEKFDYSKIQSIFLISVLLGEGEYYFNCTDEIKNHKIHVFTQNFTQIILNELDTISDFIDYLKAKESLIDTNKSIIILNGEEELLAFYLFNGRSFEKFKNEDGIVIDSGFWHKLQNKPEYKAKKEVDEISYFWDSIINIAHECSEEYELIARELARPDRFLRRCLSKSFIDAHFRADKDKKDLFRRTMSACGITYCFLFQDDPEPREKRKAILRNICWVARGTYQQNQKVLGIATDKKISRTFTYDFCLLDLPVLTEHDKRNIEKLRKKTGILTSPVIRNFHQDEYPNLK